MMNRLLQIALLALGWPQLVATASAVSVPQTSASDYIFSRPLHTNHIRGVLVGTTNAYRVIRSEDVDWLIEAFSERAAISGGSIGIPGTGVDSRVRRNDVIFLPWNIGGGWLDGDAPLLAGTRLVPFSFPTTTNIYAHTTYTNMWTNAVSLITMPMTNGTVSVYTNSWRVRKLCPVESVATNVHVWTYIDYCHGVDGVPFPAYSNLSASAIGYFDFGETHTLFPTVKSIAYARELLRGTKRIAGTDYIFTNKTRSIAKSLYDGGTCSVSTNYGGCIFQLHAGPTRAEIEQTDTFTAIVPTRFSSSLVTAGEKNRVSVEAVFATCYFSYMYMRDEDFSTVKIVQTNAIIRLGEPSLDLSGPNALCRVPMSARGLCSACAAAASVPSPPLSEEQYRTSSGFDEFWYFYIDKLVLFFAIAPSVKLPDW